MIGFWRFADGVGRRREEGVRVQGRLRSSMAVLALACATTVWFGALDASPALAVTHLPLQTFGATAQPTFGSAKAVAIDGRTGDVLVADATTNTLQRFHEDGTVAPFSSLGTNEIGNAGARHGGC